MGIILGFSQSIAKGINEDNPLYGPLKSIEREANRCNELVQSLLTFSKTSSSDYTTCTDINKLIESTMKSVIDRANLSKVKVITTLAENIPEIKLNRSNFQQVIVILCNNAIDAMPHGGELYVKTVFSPEKNGVVRVIVEDTGTGIPDEIRSKIFEPFFSTKKVGQAIGLGLALAYEIIKKHNGSIECDSKPGSGGIFKIAIPVK